MSIRISIPPLLLRWFILASLITKEFFHLLVDASESKVLQGQHLIVAFTKTNPSQAQIIRNATGYIVDVEGVNPLMLSWLSLEYNFTWSIVQTNEDFVVGLGNEGDKTSSGKLRFYLDNGLCDLVVGALAPIHSRFQYMDLLHGHLDGASALIIPKPQTINQNILAVAKPFELWVWIGLSLAIVITLGSVYLINRYLKNQPSTAAQVNRTRLFYYVVRVIVNQSGGSLASRRLAIRLVMGTWCLFAFVIVTAYQSVLISYILAPGMQPPIVDSFADLANKTNIRLLVEKGLSIDSFLSSYVESSDLKTSSTALENVYQLLGERLNGDPESRCISQQRCIDLVKEGNSAYARAISSAKNLIEKDFHDSGGRCNLALAKGKWSNTMWGWAVPKNSPYTEALNLGILRMNEAGLSTKWRLRFERDGNRCVGNDDADKNAKERRNNQRITLSNMSGSFVILLVGLLFSVTVFIVELIFRRRESPVNNHLQLPAQTHTNLINNNNGSIINTPPATLPVSSDQLNQSFVVDLPVPNTLKADSDKVINNKVAKQQYPKTVRNKSDNNKDSIEHLNEPDSESSNYDINNSLRPAKIFERKSSPIVAIDSLPQESNKELLAITINNNTPIGNDLQISAKEEDTVNNSKERMSMK